MGKDHGSNVMNHGSAERTVRICRTAGYEKWFRAEVAQALQEADNPATHWMDNAAVLAESVQRRAHWLKRARAIGAQTT